MTLCANVGWTGSEADHDRLTWAVGWMIEAHPALPCTKERWTFEDFDLGADRDFLLDRGRYDLVILHLLYDVRHAWTGNRGMFALSPWHDPERWRVRLRATQAAFIFTFGDWTEVSGETLGRIEGYDLTEARHGFHVYRWQAAQRPETMAATKGTN
jgi:hypothetical protein